MYFLLQITISQMFMAILVRNLMDMRTMMLKTGGKASLISSMGMRPTRIFSDDRANLGEEGARPKNNSESKIRLLSLHPVYEIKF